MAIAYRGTGARSKVSVATSGSPVNVAVPAGTVSTDAFLLITVCDSDTGPATPAGWTLLLTADVADYAGGSYIPPRLDVFTRVSDGGEGASVAVSFPTSTWPAGDPYVLAWITAYSGTDLSNFVENYAYTTTTAGLEAAAAQLHPAMTTVIPNAWLLTLRASSSFGSRTYTASGGSNTERVDDTDGFSELSAALYDTNAALAPGAQTQRTTTASGVCESGAAMVSIVIKPVAVAGAGYAVAGLASGAGAAFDAAPVPVEQGWDCGGDLPVYQTLIDWDDSGTSVQGEQLSVNEDFTDGTTGWDVINGSISASAFFSPDIPSALKFDSGAGVTPHVRSDPVSPVEEGAVYASRAWVYAPSALSFDLGQGINWYDSGGGFLSTSSIAYTVTPGTWQLLTFSGEAPAGATTGRFNLDMLGTPGVGSTVYLWGAMLLDPDTGMHGSQIVLTPGPLQKGSAVPLSAGATISFGRDTSRQFSPASVGSATFSVCNADRSYSPEDAGSPLYGYLSPARPAVIAATFGSVTRGLFHGRIDDYNVHADRSERTVDFSFLDALNAFQNVTLSTEVYQGMRTGELVDRVLDLAGWTGHRHIHPGATTVPFWWAENTDALAALQDLVKSEGPPAIAFVTPNNSFWFLDRHHRLIHSESIGVQATFHAGIPGCTEE